MTLAAGKIEGWRSEPGRWSHRFIKARRKEVKVEILRRSKSVEDATKVGDGDNDAKVDAVDDVQDDGYVEAESSQEPTIDDSQVSFSWCREVLSSCHCINCHFVEGHFISFLRNYVN